MMFNFGPGVGITFNVFDQFYNFFVYKLLSGLYIQILITDIFTSQKIISAKFITPSIFAQAARFPLEHY